MVEALPSAPILDVQDLVVSYGSKTAIDGIDVQRDPLSARVRMGVLLQEASFQPQLSIKQLARLCGTRGAMGSQQ